MLEFFFTCVFPTRPIDREEERVPIYMSLIGENGPPPRERRAPLPLERVFRTRARRRTTQLSRLSDSASPTEKALDASSFNMAECGLSRTCVCFPERSGVRVCATNFPNLRETSRFLAPSGARR